MDVEGPAPPRHHHARVAGEGEVTKIAFIWTTVTIVQFLTFVGCAVMGEHGAAMTSAVLGTVSWIIAVIAYRDKP